ncbi:hypothetical protein ABQX22_10820 [Xanthomonas sp. WHRI 1810A]|uniref:hypothetical protein n=1 Tax=Xanthomonas sp. WHRI 1810A TaxID=3161565 RepID=UPI0032E8AF03
MKIKNCAVGITVVSALITVGVAQAGPEVQVVFKNNGASDAIYDVTGSSAYSYSEAQPKPKGEVKAGESDNYKVTGSLSPDVTTVVFQYKSGGKVCKFKTSYLKLPGRGVAPKWNKSADASGGARCDVRVTSTNPATHAWAVEFTMR